MVIVGEENIFCSECEESNASLTPRRPTTGVLMATPRSAEPAGHDCVLCPPLRFRLNEMAGLPPGVLAKDADFYLAPDLAPLVEGHLLLVSERHFRCAGELPPALWARAERWRAEVSGLYARAYGHPGVLVLEHGPGAPGGGPQWSWCP